MESNFVNYKYYLSIAEAKEGDLVEDLNGRKIEILQFFVSKSKIDPYYYVGCVLSESGIRTGELINLLPKDIKSVKKKAINDPI